MNYFYQSHSALRNDIIQTRVPEPGLAVWSLGQAGFVIKGGNSDEYIVLDPYLTRSIEEGDVDTEFIREYDPPLAPSELKGALAVLISHHHDDHLDLPTLTELHQVSPETKFLLPTAHRQMLRSVDGQAIVGMTNAQQVEVGTFSIKPIAAAHTEYEFDADGNHLYLGYLISVHGIRIYFSGDTIVTRELLDAVRTFEPHIAMLPINGGDFFRTSRNIIGNMSGREAVDFCRYVNADLFIPFHYDMFPNNRDNPAHTVDYLFHQHRDLKFHMMALGERFVYLR
ncbi:MBL fold metallo-hydrolase [Alicyclobacillus sp. SO9]|uniref:MBL fold metallo-hydrolase n=1 Tax=Alicyclobacillus sp. SO9 TaxID=2665646 RepID=UPI0018E7804A|nr:MBL fold metallo-hydrolase [Alicyclobacillus sp. SO9]QQE77985.1 MBL fold metallo-hydrolase [Alicyclobacillus sp. SO9]